MLTQAEEKELVAEAYDDKNAFAKLYDYYFPRVYNYVHYRVDDFHAAEDLISHIFEKLFSGLKHYHSEKAVFSAWLFCIARNTITDYYRSKKRAKFTSLETNTEPVDDGPDPSDIAAFNETQQHLLKALSCLSPREREIIALKFWSGFSNRHIASIVGISESNTGVILFRAMRRLRIMMEDMGQESIHLNAGSLAKPPKQRNVLNGVI